MKLKTTKFAILTPIALATATILGCSGAGHESLEGNETTGAVDQASTIAGSSGTGALLGQGYHSDSTVFASPCVTGDVAYAGAQESLINLTKSMSYEDLSNDLNIKVGGKANFGGFSVSASAAFAITVASTKLSKSLIFGYQVRGKNAVLANAHLTPTGIAAKARDIQTVKATCGTEFVDQVELGGQLFVAVKFDFADDSIKSKFEAEIHLDIASLFSVDGSVSNVYKRYGKNVAVTILALQQGGDVSSLSTILAPEGDGRVAALHCSLEDVPACTTALNRIATYASVDFKNQLTDMRYDPSSTRGPAILTYHTTEYVNGGFSDLMAEPSPIVALEVNERRRTLLDRYLGLNADRRRALTLLDKFRLTRVEADTITAAYKIIDRNIARIADAGQYCYDHQATCIEYSNQRINELESYDVDALIKTPIFFDYCSGLDNFDENHAAMPVVDTINAIKDQLGTRDCLEAEALMNEATVLEFKDHTPKLQDVRPLRNLPNLTSLGLRNNAVKNLSPLSNSNIVTLDVRNNGIISIGGVAKMKSLRSLDAAYNGIYDVTPIAKLTDLTSLKLQGNPITDFSPLNALTKLTFKIYNNANICDAERKWLLDARMVSRDDFDFYGDMNFGPVYAQAGKRTSGISTWAACDSVATTLPAGL